MDDAGLVSKRCTRCGTSKPASHFSRRRASKDGLQPCCKAGQASMDRRLYRSSPQRRDSIRAANERRRVRQTQRLHDLKAARGCADCGETDPVVLEFDHVDPSTKVGDIAAMAAGSWAAVIAEVRKCEVVCANCHRRRTCARRQGR